jgi:hypothetical protein
MRKYTLRLLTLPPSHPVVRCCPSTFPIPNHFLTSIQTTHEYDHEWQSLRHPPSRLVRNLSSLTDWISPATTIEDTAHPVLAPWKPHPITIEISPSPKEEAAIEHITLLQHLRRHEQNVIAYTDGSQLDGNTGAGYYIPRGMTREVRAIVPMGATSEVFDAELRAIFECLVTCHKYIRLNRLPHRSIHLFTDNQSAIIHSSCLSSGPGQELAHAINDMLRTTGQRLLRRGRQATHEEHRVGAFRA